MKKFTVLFLMMVVVLVLNHTIQAQAQGTVFTYQGKLNDNGLPANGQYDLKFQLFDDPNIAAGIQIGSAVTHEDISMYDGYFTVALEFSSDPNLFNGDARWLEIAVRSGQLTDPNQYSNLTPRQPLTSVPYAQYALKSGSGSGSDADSDPTNELQSLGLNGNTLSISLGNSVLLPTGGDADSDPTNEFQTLGLNGSTLSISNGNSVLLPTGGGGDFDWTINGSDMYSAVSGNVGIGTTTPDFDLDIYGAEGLRVTETAGADSTFTFGEFGETIWDYAGLEFARIDQDTGPSGFLQLSDQDNPKVQLHSDGISYFNGGDVGIGTTSPTSQLSINGDIDINGSRLHVGTDGNIGIGTSSPAAKLDVSGDISASSVYQIGGNTVLSIAGIGNTFSGSQAGYSNTIGSVNTFSGNHAGYSNTEGDLNTFSGYYAGYSNTIGYLNTFLGGKAGYSNTEGKYNTFSGGNAGYSNTTGKYNTFSGGDAGYSNTTGEFNTFSGTSAGYSNTTGNSNTFSGYRAGYSNFIGYYNTFLGYLAGTANIIGHDNTFSGYRAGDSNTSGNFNTFLGNYTGDSNTTGEFNTFLGSYAGYSNTGGDRNVFLGYSAGYHETGDDKLYIDNSDTNTPLIHGDFATNRVGINRVSTANTLEVGGNASKATAGSWLANSDARIKTDIQTVTGALDAIDKVRLISFKYTDDYRIQHPGIEDRPYLNVVAQEFAEVFPNYVKSSGETLSNGSEILQVDTYPLTIYSAAAVQELYQIVQEKDAEIEALKVRLSKMESLMNEFIQSKEGDIQ